MASINQVTIELRVQGERAATKALKDFSDANKRVGSSVGEVARKVSSIEGEYKSLAAAQQRGALTANELRSAKTALARQLATLTGMTEAEARAALTAATAAQRKAEADRRAADAAERLARSQRNLEGSILKQAQAVNQAVNRMAELERLKMSGAVGSRNLAQAELEIARSLARTNGYLTSNGALNVQKALAEIRAAQATRDAAAAEAAKVAATQRASQAYRQLMASINPTIAAQQRLSQGVQAIRAAQRAGVISTQEAIAALRQLRAAQDAAAAGANFASRGLNRTGVVAQQAGYQVGDFFVQIQSGTNVMVAFGQQATQLVGTFAMFARTTRAAMIASGIGIFISIATAVGAAIMRMNGQMQTLEQTVQDVESSFNDWSSALDRVEDQNLDQTFGNMTESVRSLSESMVELNNAAALNNLVATLDRLEDASTASVFRQIGEGALNIGRFISPFAQGEGPFGLKLPEEVDEEAFERLGFSMARAQYNAYLDEMQRLAGAGDIEGVTALIDRFMQDATDNGAELSMEGISVAQSFAQVALSAAEAAAQINGSAEASRLAAEAAERDLQLQQERMESLLEEGRIAEEGRVARQEMIAEMQQEIEMQRTIAQFGERSVQVEQLRAEQARNAVLARVEETTQNQVLIDQVMAIYDAQVEVADATRQTADAARQTAEQQERLNALLQAGRDAQMDRARNERSYLIDLENQLAIAEAVLEHGRDSIQVVRLRAQQEAIANNLTEQGAQRAMELAVYLHNAEKAAEGIASINMAAGIAEAGIAAATLATQLGISLATARAIAGAAGGAQAAQGVASGDIPPWAMEDLPDAPMSDADRVMEDFLNQRRELFRQSQIPPTGGGGGGGGGAAGFESLIPGMEALAEAVRAANEQAQMFEQNIEILDDALQHGLITQQQYNDMVSQVEEAYGQATQAGFDYEAAMQQISETAKSAMGDAFMSIVDGSKTAADAFKDMARRILAQAFELLVVQPIMDSLFGGGGKGGGGGGFLRAIFSANGNVFSNGNVVPFADGGIVSSPTMFPMRGPQTGLMGEAGPEAIMPLKRTRGGKLGVVAEGGGQQPIVIHQSFNFSANGDESVKRIIAAEAPKIAAYTEKQIVDSRKRGGAMKGAFG